MRLILTLIAAFKMYSDRTCTGCGYEYRKQTHGRDELRGTGLFQGFTQEL